MLESTFLHVPTIGEKREAHLWREGYTDWRTFRRDHPPGPFRDHVLRYLDRDTAARGLPRHQSWRIFPAFSKKILYLDIETTGLTPDDDAVTCVGTYDGRTARAYVQGRDLERFENAIDEADLLVTYNGACFDLPFLRSVFPRVDLDRPLHIDLRYPLHRLGFRGGLKGIEPQLGIHREDALQGVDGYMAVLLWREHRAGSAVALDTLVRYCLEDVVNLEPLMVETFNRMAAALPIDVPRVEPGPRPDLPCRADPELVRDLLRRRERAAY
jgi:uncharacterized protein YprB with RNaseH-like and TPR domain